VAVDGERRDSEPIISIDHVGFVYPVGLRAISDVTFSVAHGEILAIVGPSGCGKSTLLRLLANLAAPTAGKIRRHFGKRGDGSLGCSMVFQEDTLLPWFRVRDNVGLYFKLHHKRGADVSELVARLLKMVGLDGFADYFPSQLSGGMKRRIVMLTAVAPLPDLLLLDEPFSALDEPTRIAIHQDLHRLIKEFGISAVLVTHDLAEAITLSDRVLLLSRAPARIISEVTVPFGYERDLMDLRASPEFLRLYGHLWNELKSEIDSRRQEP
jgi:NitT/TauT family transport system ATP-binding protein